MKSNLSSLFDNAKKVTLVSVPAREPSPEPEPESEPEETEEPEPTKKTKKKVKPPREEVEDPEIVTASTVFVGNVPTGCNQKELKRLFSQYGTVQSVRLRSLIPLHPKRGKRLAFIKKELHPLQKTVNAFVRFTDPREAQSATHLNGHVYKDHHLRVDLAHDQREDIKHDYKRSIFIGNLPFDVNDDDVWKAFEECGEVESVRLVRDRETSVGKGFGYVLFQDEAAVSLALRMNGSCKVGNREIRIKAAMKKPKANKDRPTTTTMKKPFVGRKRIDRKDSPPVNEGRVGKRPALKVKKELQKKKKKKLTTKTTNASKDHIQLKKNPLSSR